MNSIKLQAMDLGISPSQFEILLLELDARVMSKGETPREAAEAVTGGNRVLDALLVFEYQGGR